MTMRRRLMLVAAATTIMVVIAFVVPLGLLVKTLAAERVLTSARQVAGALAPALASGDRTQIDTAIAVATSSTQGEISVILPDGSVIGPAIPGDVALRARQGAAFEVDGEGTRAIVTPIVGGGGATSVVMVDIPEERLRAGVLESWLVLGGLGVLMVVGAVVVADRLARQITRSVDDVSDAAHQLSAGNHDVRAPVAGPPEIAEVAEALNSLADRIDDLLTAEREAAADLSHRLRTPLTALRLDVESLRDHPDASRLAADLAALERAVDQQIRAVRSGGRVPTTTDVVAVARDRHAFWEPLADDENRPATATLPDHPVFVRADHDEVESALDVLIGNVFAHTPAGTGFDLGVRVDGDQVEVAVTDDGPGFPEGIDLTVRGVSGRGSTGLGLDICRRLAESIGGELLVDSPGGARVRLRLPTNPVA